MQNRAPNDPFVSDPDAAYDAATTMYIDAAERLRLARALSQRPGLLHPGVLAAAYAAEAAARDFAALCAAAALKAS